jgi:hypothetical protein
MTISQGAKANNSGQKLETAVSDLFTSLGLTFKAQAPFTDVYGGTRARMDFYIEDLDCAVECKRQNVSGTVDQKLPFVFDNLQIFPAVKGLLVLEGNHYESRVGIHKYLNTKVSDCFDWCFLHELEEWIIEQTNSRKTS